MQFFIYCMIALVSAVISAIAGSLSIGSTLLLFLAVLLLCIFVHAMTIVIGSFFIDFENPPKKCGFFRYVTLATISLMHTYARILPKVIGREKLPQEKFLFVSNHYSAYDPVIAMNCFKKYKLGFVSKKENVNLPFVGKFMFASDVIPLDRENPKSAVKTISKAAENISSQKCSMGIYPEGTRNKNPKEVKLQPFHDGSFKIATKSKAPIVVAVTRNTDRITKSLFTRAVIEIVRVIDYSEYEGMKTNQISQMVYKILEDSI